MLNEILFYQNRADSLEKLRAGLDKAMAELNEASAFKSLYQVSSLCIQSVLLRFHWSIFNV